MSNKPSMGLSLSNVLPLLESLQMTYGSHRHSSPGLKKLRKMIHLVSTVELEYGRIHVRAEAENGSVWISAQRAGFPDAVPADRLFYSPEKGWRRQQVDPRGGFPRLDTLSVEAVAEDILVYVGPPHGSSRDKAASLLAAALTAAVPSLEAIHVMDS